MLDSQLIIDTDGKETYFTTLNFCMYKILPLCAFFDIFAYLGGSLKA